MTNGLMTVVDFDRGRLRKAKQALEGMDAFGLQEDLEGFAQELERRYGWNLGPPVHENATRPTDVPPRSAHGSPRTTRSTWSSTSTRGSCSAGGASRRGRSSTEGAVAVLEIGPPDRIAVGGGTAFVLAGHCHSAGRAHDRSRGAGRRRTSTGAAVRAAPRRRLRAPRGRRPGPAARLPQRLRLAGALLPGQALGERPLSFVVAGPLGRRPRPGRGARRRRRSRMPPEAGSAEFTGTGPRVAICMATYDPPPDLLRRQLDSIREQTHGNWICLISDDCSDPSATSRSPRP